MGIQKAVIQNLSTHRSFEVPINPEEYSVDSSNSFQQAGMHAGFPTLEFTGRELHKLQLELFFDGSHRRVDVRGMMRPVLDLLEKDPTTGAPPLLLVSWGSLQCRCVLESAGQRYTQFLSSGIPVRADLRLSFLETQQPGLAPSVAGSAELGQTTLVHQGESLTQVAQRTTGDPSRWREIADENKIDNPRKPPPNRALRLPAGSSGRGARGS
jgi:hypothetical protein